MKNKSSFVRRHGFGVVGMLLLGVLGMCLFSIPAEAFSLSIPPLPKIPMPSPMIMMNIAQLVIYFLF